MLGPISKGMDNQAFLLFGAEVRFQFQIVGVVHNHPLNNTIVDGQINEAIFQTGLRPSEGPTSDRSLFADMVSNGAHDQVFRSYIIGPDDLIRQYDYYSPLGQTSSDVVNL